MKPALEVQQPCEPTALPADEAAKLAAWLVPHVAAIEQIVARLKEKGLPERDVLRFHAGWARYELKELLYEARKASGVVEGHWIDRQAVNRQSADVDQQRSNTLSTPG